jgi:hypothetical protein
MTPRGAFEPKGARKVQADRPKVLPSNAGSLDKAKVKFQAEYERLRQVASRPCAHCGKPFVPKQTNSRYCSVSCRNLTYSRRRSRSERHGKCFNSEPPIE